MKNNNKISFVLDGKITNVDFNESGYGPTTTLLNYLRSLPTHKSVKEGCGEGDCGACTVVMGEVIEGKISYKAYDSCLIFLPSIHGKQVITAENLGNSDNLHPVQKALYDFDGTQCGFCTPGFVMSIYALYKQENQINKQEIKNALAGNLCRCTGYRPIVEAAEYVCKNKTDDNISENEKYIKELLNSIDMQNTIYISSEEQKYYLPFCKSEALRLKKEYPNALIVTGATDVALRVTKKHEILSEIIDLSLVKDLKFVKKLKNHIIYGSNFCLEDVRNNCKEELPALYNILSVFGSRQIRNRAALGGNIGSASPIGDTIPVLMAYDTSVVLEKEGNRRAVKLREFITGYRQTKCESNELITEIHIPIPNEKNIIKSYKVSKRKDLDISTVSACFSLNLKNNIVNEIAIFYGGMSAWTRRAVNTENTLLTKEWNRKNVELAMKELAKDYKPISDARSGEKARNIMAANLLLKFWSESSL